MEKPTKEQIEQWVSALRSGKYKQTAGRLQDENGYCCLGVACDLFIPQYKIKTNGHLLQMFGEHPLDQPSSPRWLDNVNDHFDNSAGTELTRLNDEDGFTFDEIADLLEAVYILEVLN